MTSNSSIMLKSLFSIPFLVGVQMLLAQSVLISESGYPNEPSIMMKPQEPNVLIAAARLNKYYISTDNGRTWTKHNLQSSFGVWADPVIVVDVNNDFYFFHLSNLPDGNWIDHNVCQKSIDNCGTMVHTPDSTAPKRRTNNGVPSNARTIPCT